MRILFALLLFFQLSAASAQAKEAMETLTVTNSDAWAPYSFIGDNGEPRGLLIDLWREFGRRNNRRIEFKLMDWSDSLKALKDNGNVIHGGLFKSEERARYMDFTEPLNLPMNTRLFVSTKLKINRISELGNIPLAVAKDGYAETYLRKKYPEINLATYRNENVVSDAHLAFVTDYPAAMYHLHRQGAYDKFYVGQTLYTKKLRIAVRKDNDELLKFIETGMKQIPPQEFDRITQKWIQAVTLTPDWLLPAAVTCFGGIAGGFVFLYIFALRRQVAARTRELLKISQTDMLTGLYNRRQIDTILHQEFERFKRYKQPLTLILVDIDNFKKINDIFGHTVGDEVLISFAEIISSSTRNTDFIGRWGGEEFIVICPQTTSCAGVIIAEKLRSCIETSEFNTIGSCTASFGVTEINEDDDFISIFNRCDTALYRSKNDGRNRVTAG